MDAVRAAIRTAISTHALREEGDQLGGGHRLGLGNFYPRPPRGGRRACRPITRPRPCGFLPTPSARRATRRCRSPG